VVVLSSKYYEVRPANTLDGDDAGYQYHPVIAAVVLKTRRRVVDVDEIAFRSSLKSGVTGVAADTA
jgi:hypothetical protein